MAGDADTTNDAITVEVENTVCQPESNCEGFNDGVTMLQLADQDLMVDCSSSGYTDNTDIVFNFVLEDNPYDGVLQMGWPDSSYAMWIDWNDNFVFEPTEIVETGSVPNADTDFPFNIDLSVFPGLNTGEHLMRVRGEDTDQAGNVLDPCDDLAFGRTNDFTANVTGVLGVDEQGIADADLIITSSNQEVFEITLSNPQITSDLNIQVHNVMGQKILSNMIANQGGTFTYTLDMSYVSSGVYLVRVGNANYGKVKRIIVK